MSKANPENARAKLDARIVLVARALNHPIRVQILREFRHANRTSPVKFASAQSEPIGNVAHHFKVLRDAGVIKIVDEIDRRGSKEHIHVLGGPQLSMTLDALEVLEGGRQ